MEETSTKRLLATETLDPNGALPRWVTPGIRRLGWEAWSLPTLEAVQLLGPSGYADLVTQIVEQLRPHILLVHPPYDYLSAKVCREIRTLNTRIIGWGFDDPLFERTWNRVAWADMAERFDLWVTTTVNGPTVEAWAQPVLWVMAAESVEIDDPAAPTHEAVLIGRHTKQREATARAVAAKGIQIACYGFGWANGPVTRPSMLGLMRRAKAVITPCDGVNAAKVRMIEAALVGAHQIVEYSPDLDRYLFGEEMPAIYRTAEGCAERLSSNEPLPDWTHLPGWDVVWPKLISDLTLAEQPKRSRSVTLNQLYASLAHIYEQQGHLLAATMYLDAWATADPDNWGPKFALARCAHTMKRWEKVVKLTEEIANPLKQHVPAAAKHLRAFIPASGLGKGLGESGAVDSGLELNAIRLHSLVMNGQFNLAMEEVAAMSSSQRAAVRATMFPDYDNPDVIELLGALAKE